MVLLIITAVQDFKSEIRKMLKDSAIHNYSYFPVTGHKDNHDQSNTDNWFAGGAMESDSVMFQVFTDNENGNKMIQKSSAFNELQETGNHIHLLKLQVTDVL